MRERVRRALETLPREYRIWADCRWLRRTGHGGRAGEADFVVAHEYRGAVVLAVPRAGEEAAALEARAIEGRYALQGKMREHPRSQRDWTVGFAIVRPEAQVEPPAHLDPAVVIDAHGLAEIRRAMDACLEFWRPTTPGPLGMQILEEILARPAFAEVEAQLVRLTDEQMRLLDFLAGHPRAAIRGCAGSGKTLLAVQKARRLAAEGFRTLFVCFNRMLGLHVARLLDGIKGVEALHFHELCVRRARAAGLEIVGPQDSPLVEEEMFFGVTLPGLLEQSSERLADRYDALVVDEGQDFRPGWWRALESVARPDAVVYVFYDDNQAIFGPPVGMPIATLPYTLTRNCRQTAALHEWVARHYRGVARPGTQGPPGEPPLVATYEGEEELHAALERVLEGWLGRRELSPRDVVVLTPYGRASRVWRRRRYGAWTLTEEWPAGPGQVTWATVHRFKGLESPAVVLAEVEPDPPGGLPMVLYVGGSRARHRLAVIASQEVASVVL